MTWLKKHEEEEWHKQPAKKKTQITHTCRMVVMKLVNVVICALFDVKTLYG